MKVFVFVFVFVLLFASPCMAHTVNHFAGAPLEIIKIGHPTLRMTAEEVPYNDIATPEFQKFLDDMLSTMKSAGGVGLAAPQVNVSKRVFVMSSGMSVPTTFVINPKVEYLDQYGTKSSTEGCLSIPGQRVRVKRYKRIHMDYINRHGDYISEEATGFKAVIAQHEYDHLNGIMIVDLLGLGAEIEAPEDYVSVPLM